MASFLPLSNIFMRHFSLSRFLHVNYCTRFHNWARQSWAAQLLHGSWQSSSTVHSNAGNWFGFSYRFWKTRSILGRFSARQSGKFVCCGFCLASCSCDFHGSTTTHRHRYNWRTEFGPTTKSGESFVRSLRGRRWFGGRHWLIGSDDGRLFTRS